MNTLVKLVFDKPVHPGWDITNLYSIVWGLCDHWLVFSDRERRLEPGLMCDLSYAKKLSYNYCIECACQSYEELYAERLSQTTNSK